jgi:hypothetical protein
VKKTTLLGVLNLILVIWFTVILLKSHYTLEPFVSFYSVFKAYASLFIIFLFDLINACLAYLLFIKPPKKISYPVIATLTFAPLFWFVFAFIGFFFASRPLLPISGVIIALICYFYVKKQSHRVALFLSLGTLFVMGIILLSSFEEDYCIKRGDLADPTGTRSIAATREDAQKLHDMGVIKGQEIGIAFRSHMLCHNTFNLYSAVMKSYFSR